MGVWGNYVWCPVIVALFTGLGGAKRWGGKFEVMIWEVSHNGGIFMGWS